MIGDNNRDIEAGKQVGLSGIKIKPNQNLLDVISLID
jgi:phosphoglycolate phosphatase-like HAD superfamily hydrolase